MKVIYKKPILEKIMEEKFKAEVSNKEIEKIILTKPEYEDLKSSVYSYSITECKNIVPNQVYGIPFEVEDL